MKKLKRGKNYTYESVEFSTFKHEFIKIPDENGKYIPCILIRPNHCFNVLIIYSHGNSCDIGISFFECVDISLNTNCCVLIYEYPGYGLCNNKKLKEEWIYYNIRKAYLFAKKELNFSHENIILFGHSLGSGPCIDMAIDEKYPVGGVVLLAPFLSILRTVAEFKSTLFFDCFPNLDKIKFLKVPLLIFHGTKDSIVSIKDGEKLSKLINYEYLYEFMKVTDGDHNDIIRNHKPSVYKKLREFLNHVTKINFSINSKNSKVDVNSDFFKKLHPHKGDDECNPMNEEKIINEDDLANNFVIRNFIESENNKNNDVETFGSVFQSNLKIDEKLDVKNKDIIIEILDKEKNQIISEID